MANASFADSSSVTGYIYPITIKFASDIARLKNVFLASFVNFELHPWLERAPWFL